MTRGMGQISMACRMAIFLNLDKDPDDLIECKNMNWVEKETRRRTWAVCYQADKCNGPP